MDHEHAVRELAAERYLLGELTGDAREAFEAHLFECTQCSAEVKSSVRMAEALRVQLATQPVHTAHSASSRLHFLDRWLKPMWLAPALTACLALVLYQNAAEIPQLKNQITNANTPELLSSLVLAGGASRGSEVPRVSVAQGHSFLLSVDIPPGQDVGTYICTLYSPSGRAVWSLSITAEQARDTIQLRIPAGLTEPGRQTLTIQANGGVIATMPFLLDIRG